MAASPANVEKGKKRTTIIVVLLLILGAGLRLATVPTSFVWLDEANSILGASKSLPGILHWLRTQENGPPLFYFLLHYWIKLFGNSDVVCALMPLLFSVFTPLCIYFLSRELFGTKASLWALFLSSVNYGSIQAATYIRFYSLLELLTSLSYLLFFKMMRSGKHFWLYVLISVLGIYEHYYFAFVILSQLVICLIFHRKRALPLLGALCIVAVAFAPWVPTAITQFGSGANSWLQEVSGPRHLISLLYGSLFVNSRMFLQQPVLLLQRTALAFIVLFLGIWTIRLVIFRERIPLDDEDISIYSIVITFLSCVGLPILISMVKPIYEPQRYDIAGLPLIILFFSWAFSKIQNRWLILFLILFYLIKTYGYQAAAHRSLQPATGEPLPLVSNDKLSTKKLSKIIEPDDIIVYTSLSKLATDYYLNHNGVPVKKSYMFPSELENHPCWRDLDKMGADTEKLKKDAQAIADSLQEISPSRIFVFYGGFLDKDKEISDYFIAEMDRRFELDRTLDWSGSFYEKILVYTAEKKGPGVGALQHD